MFDIKGYTLLELETLLCEWGEPKYRAAQLYKWLHVKRASSFEQMTDLAKGLREKLAATCVLPQLSVVSRLIDPQEGTVKYLFELVDGEKVEAVYMPLAERRTLCVSSQAGCKFNCRMCLTGGLGFKRNLTAAEILAQIDLVSSEQEPLTNLVFMGMGEPLDNFANLTRALTLLSDPAGRGFSLRRVTVSTIGLMDKVSALYQLGLIPNITISLNATTDAARDQLMPVNRKYPLAVIIKALKELPLPPRRRFTIAYVLIKGFNDSREDARRLVKLLPQKRVKINLIPFNPHPRLDFLPPDSDIIEDFQKILVDSGFAAFIRQSRGRKIKAACGQLAAGDENAGNETL